MKIKVVSFNVQHFENFISHNIDFEGFAKAIASIDADIIGLNEVRGKGIRDDYKDQVKIISEKLGYYYYFAQAILIDGTNPYGNAIISRYPILSAETIIIPDPEPKSYNGYYETRCLLKAKIDIRQGLDVYVTHFGLNPDEHINCVNTVCDQIGENCILMGDFNVTPDNEALNPIKRILEDTAKNNINMLTFPSDRPKIKIDYIFIGRKIKTLYSEVLPIIISDHRPYLAELEI